MNTKKPSEEGLVANSLQFGCSAVKLWLSHHMVILSQSYIPMSSAQRVCEKTSCGCSIVKSKAIGSTWSGFTPTEPNWTDKPAVINDGDIQHFSGMEPLSGV